ncbi:MAG: hypothetical protein ABI859_01265 [Pseudomonadota bacterium]
MAAAQKQWKVLPHGKLTALDTDMWTVVGEMPLPFGVLPRRMTIVRLWDSRLVIFSAIALTEEAMRELEGCGVPSFLIVPNAHHRFDARVWKERYPMIKVLCPSGARAKVQEVVPVDGTNADFRDARILFLEVPGTDANEGALQVTRRPGITLILNDLVGNVPRRAGFFGWVLRRLRFSDGGPQIPLPTQAGLIQDRHALRAQLLRWAALPRLKRVVVSHGAIIDQWPKETLRNLASSLTLD